MIDILFGVAHREFGTIIRNFTQINSSIVNTQQFMHHCLVSPLRQQWRYRIITSVKK